VTATRARGSSTARDAAPCHLPRWFVRLEIEKIHQTARPLGRGRARGEAALRFLASRTGPDFAWAMVLVMVVWYCNRKQRGNSNAGRRVRRVLSYWSQHISRNPGNSISLDSRPAAFPSSPKAATQQKLIKQRASEARQRREREREKKAIWLLSISLAKESQSRRRTSGSRSGWWAHVSCSSCFGGGVCGCDW
jgi:hypothetical protein